MYVYKVISTGAITTCYQYLTISICSRFFVCLNVIQLNPDDAAVQEEYVKAMEKATATAGKAGSISFVPAAAETGGDNESSQKVISVLIFMYVSYCMLCGVFVRR